MNWDRIAGEWKQLKGNAQQRWGKLTDNDWALINGKREELVGKVQSLYGKRKDDAEREVDDWESRLSEGPDKSQHSFHYSGRTRDE
jgi:uncharacterized protein YjbJ (UPF0337 family)